MTLHLIKLCVGIESVEHLQEHRAARRARGETTDWITTRQTPRRAEEILDGGSLYWVIRGVVRVRQPILAFEPTSRWDGIPCCRIDMDPTLTRVEPREYRPFQGWRYLRPDQAPADLRAGTGVEDMPAEMAAELRSLGLL